MARSRPGQAAHGMNSRPGSPGHGMPSPGSGPMTRTATRPIDRCRHDTSPRGGRRALALAAAPRRDRRQPKDDHDAMGSDRREMGSDEGSARIQWPDISEEDALATEGKREKLVALVQRTYSMSEEDAETEVEEWRCRV